MVKGVIIHMFQAFHDMGNPFVNSTMFDEWNLQIQSYQEKVVVDKNDDDFMGNICHKIQATLNPSKAQTSISPILCHIKMFCNLYFNIY